MVRFSDLVEKLSGDDDDPEERGEETSAMSDTPGPTGTPADGPPKADEGLTSEERAMLDSLSGPSARKPESPRPEETHDGDEIDGAFTAEERDMLEHLQRGDAKPTRPPAVETEEVDEEVPPAGAESAQEVRADDQEEAQEVSVTDAQTRVEVAPEAPVTAEAGAPPTTPPPRPAQGPLSGEEEEVLERARTESERVSEAVPAMFEKKPEPPPEPADETPEEVLIEENLESLEPDAQVAPPAEPSRVAKTIAVPFDLINKPFTWLPPVWRMGLGLCGVLLLITLLLVILVGQLVT